MHYLRCFEYFFLFSSLLPFINLFRRRVLFIVYLDRAFFVQDIWLPFACFCVKHKYLIFFYIHQKTYVTFSFSFMFTVTNSDNKSILNLSFLSSIIHYFQLKFLKGCSHNSGCHLVKIKQTYYDYTRVLETSRFISQNEVYATRFNRALKEWLFNKAFQLITVAKNWNSTTICLPIKISYNKFFVMWWM